MAITVDVKTGEEIITEEPVYTPDQKQIDYMTIMDLKAQKREIRDSAIDAILSDKATVNELKQEYQSLTQQIKDIKAKYK